MRAATTPPSLTTLVFLTAFATLSLNMFLPSLAGIAQSLRTEYALVSLSIPLYLAVTGIVMLVAGPLSDYAGRRPVLLVSFLLFTLASAGCAMALNVWTFLFFRMLQGTVVSGYVLSLAIVRDTTVERKTASLIGYISMAMAIAPLLGPVLGGLLDSFFGWRTAFWFYTSGGLLLSLLIWYDLGETRNKHGLSSIKPVLSTRFLLSSSRFWAFASCLAFSTGAFYIFLSGAPLVAATVFGISTASLGLFIGSITAGFIAGSFAATRLSSNFAALPLILSGRLIACGGLLLGVLFLYTGLLTPLTYFGSTIFVGFGNGLTLPGCNASIMSIKPELAGTAVGIAGALTVFTGALLTSITSLLITGTNVALILLLLMFGASLSGLLAALWAARKL